MCLLSKPLQILLEVARMQTVNMIQHILLILLLHRVCANNFENFWCCSESSD